jgi:hypothetical protein
VRSDSDAAVTGAALADAAGATNDAAAKTRVVASSDVNGCGRRNTG